MSRKTRKLIWSAPLVAVLAVAGALAMFVALGPGSVFANPLPAAPSDLKVAAASGDAGRTTLVLSWTGPDGGNVSGYRIDKVEDSGAIWETVVMDTGSTATSYTDSTLTAEDTRLYRVFAVNSHGVSPVSNAASGTTDKKVNPGSVMNLRAVPNTKNPYMHIDLSWDAPTANGGEKIVGYEVQYHNGSDWGNLRGTFDATGNRVTVTTKTKITDTSTDDAELDAGDKRLYRVRAVNGPAEVDDVDVFPVPDTSAASVSRSKEWARVEAMTKAATIPGQVTGLTAVNATATSINLYWYDPEDTGGWNIDGYLVQARRDGKKFLAIPKDEDLTNDTITPTTPPTLGGLATTANVDNANVYVDRRAAANVLQAAFIGIDEVDHDGDDTDNDGVKNNAPVGADATAHPATAIRQVTWYFRVYAVTVDDGPNDAVEANDGNTTTDDVIRRSRGPSNEASDVAAARPIAYDHDKDPATPAIDVDPLAAPDINATGSSGDSDHLKQEIRLVLTVDGTLTSPTPDVEQIGYRIDYSKNGIAWKLLERSTRFTGFGEGKPYDDDNNLGFDEPRYYRVFTIGKDPYTDVGLSSDISEGSTADSTAPKKPTGVTASAPSLRSIMASWTAPEDNGGQDIVKYYYQYVPDDDDEVAEAEDFAADSNGNFTGNIPGGTTDDAMTMGTLEIKSPAPALAGETVYVFRVAAVNKDGADDRPANAAGVVPADWSEPSLFSTTEAAKPNAVEGLTSEAATDTSGTVTGVNLLWNKPSDKIKIDNYDIEVQDDEGDWVNPTLGENSSKTRTSYTDSDELEADEVRVYRVRADNDVGEGPWTMVYYPRSAEADHPHGTTKPTNVQASSGAAGELMLTWEGGDNADSYLLIAVNMADTSDYKTTVVSDGAAQMATVTGLTSGVNYLGIVVALQGTGDDQTFSYGASGVQAVQ